MSTYLILILCFILVIFFSIKSKNIHIDFKSFFKRGFLMTDDMFGVVCYTGGQGKGKTYRRCAICY